MATDKFGALALDPVPTTTRSANVGTLIGSLQGPPGDPLLYYVGEYLKTVINAQCGAAYLALDPLKKVPVLELDYVDPEDHSFNARDLPALYLYRDTFPAERVADDRYIQKSRIAAHWVPFPINLQRRQERAPFVNALAAVINRAIIRGRHPSWVVPGDTDPDAAYFGSSLIGWTGAHKPFAFIESKRTTIEIKGHEGEYTGLKVVLQAEELLVEDLDLRYFPANAPTGTTGMATGIQQKQSGGDGTSAYVVEMGDVRLALPP